MKKLFVVFTFLFMLVSNVEALEANDATIVSCDNSEEYVILVNNKYKRIRLHNYTRDNTDINKTIDEYTCKKVMGSKNIKVALTGNSDKYNFEYAILYVDNRDIREELISLGYGQVSNVESYSTELDNLCAIEKTAIINKLGIWKYVEKEDFCQNNIINIIETDNTKTIKEENKQFDVYKLTTLFLSSMLILILCACIIKKRG